MRRERVRIGETYLLPVVVSEYAKEGNMVRVITLDDGEAVSVHPDALQDVKRTIDLIPLTKGGRHG